MKKAFRTFKYEILYTFVLLFSGLTRVLPRFAALQLYSVIGRLSYLMFKKDREVTLKNLQFAFGAEKNTQEINKIAKRSWINLSKSLMEFVRYKNIKSIEDYKKFIEIKGLEHVEEAQKRGQGVFIMTSHFGPFEICLYIFALLGYKIASTGSPLKYKKLHDLLVENRSRNGAEYFERNKASIKMLRQLKSGNLMGVLIDQDTSKIQHTFINFFGKECATPSGPATLLVKTGAAVVPMHIIRNEDDSLILEIQPYRTYQKDDDVKAVTQELHNLTEEIVRLHPDQWVWMHDRWRTRPSEPKIENPV
ncbi:lysophospholipid acyltransferase family protein [Sediminitomix flava]|uniref:KDO2-lipid IV(A) lauroyltransferase n=1 Tax=Sediminitomix flava TaxID=379075 RepID=A0A315Z952_SEDFL|nr:lysophospholipid acyltransferase family protein [Sediminitomix flava]PWJ42031.1 KDO2-lipid IV(A) lauroyltransferase [Sediminitomix flava]